MSDLVARMRRVMKRHDDDNHALRIVAGNKASLARKTGGSYAHPKSEARRLAGQRYRTYADEVGVTWSTYRRLAALIRAADRDPGNLGWMLDHVDGGTSSIAALEAEAAHFQRYGRTDPRVLMALVERLEGLTRDLTTMKYCTVAKSQYDEIDARLSKCLSLLTKTKNTLREES